MSAPATGLAVRTQRLVHIYHSEGHDVAALSGVDLDVAAGERVGLLGPSGAGKSTLLGLLGGLFQPSAGRITIGDTDITRLSGKPLDRLRSTEVSLMLQGAARNLLPYLDAHDNVAFAQRTARAHGKDLPPPGDVLESLGLADRATAPLTDLTPGHLQLAALAVAIAAGPGLLLADEPTSQLDHDVRDVVLDRLAQVNRTFGTTVLLVTHDPEVAARLPRTVTIRDGKVGGEGRSGEEYAVVTADGFLPLPPDVQAALAPGTLVRFHPSATGYDLVVEDESADPGGEA